FIVDEHQKRYLVAPNSSYKVSLIQDDEDVQSWSFRTNKWMLFDPNLFEQETDLTKGYERILLIGTHEYYKQLDDGQSEVIVNPLFNTWQGYYELDVYAKNNCEYNLETNKLILQ